MNSTAQMNAIPEDIAIIGLSGLFAGSQDKDAFWQNIITKRDNVGIAPDSWALPWYDPKAPSSIDSARIHTRKVGLIGDLAVFHPLEFGIPPRAVEGDPAHFLALQLAGDALRDAGYHTRPFNRERTGVIVGHGTNPNRGDVGGLQYGLMIDQTVEVVTDLLPHLSDSQRMELREALKKGLPPIEMEMTPSLISNVISGRIANRLDLMGPNYLVDSACSSSLIAVDLGVQDLRSGRCDMMLVGGVQASMPAQIYMMFQNLGALTMSDIRPYDTQASGTLLGEGVGFAVIKRVSDAVRDGDRIYALIKGAGIASDGKAKGLLAPRLEGEVLAIRRAYEQTGIDPDSVGLIEGHGTGIRLGDQTEIQALAQVFGHRRGKLPDCALGSVKSMIGHCIPAAGMASLIKVALSLYYKTLPPTLCDAVNPELGIEATRFYINTETRPWIHGEQTPRRAGINAFGFGGINSHVILEEFRDPNPGLSSRIGSWLLNPRGEKGQLSTLGKNAGAPEGFISDITEQTWFNWPSELIVLSDKTRDGLMARVGEVVERLHQHPTLPLASLACELCAAVPQGDARLAVIASHREDLLEKLQIIADKLPGHKSDYLASRKGIYYSEREASNGKTAFMFASEGSQYPNMLVDLAIHFPKVRLWFDFLDEVFPRTPRPSSCIFPPPTCVDGENEEWLKYQLYKGDLATESLSIASHALYELLFAFRIPCDVMIGHSAGEHVALRAAGRVKTESIAAYKEVMRGLNQVYQSLEDSRGIPTGSLISIGAIKEGNLRSLQFDLADRLFVVAENCQNQLVLFVTADARDLVISRLQEAGAIYAELPFNRAYHTPLFAEGAQALRCFYDKTMRSDQPKVPVYSCSTAAPYPEDDQECLEVAATHWVKPVLFRQTIEALYREGVRLFIEVGASNSLTAFVDNILKGKDYKVMAANVQGRPALEQFQHLLGQLYVNKMDMDLSPLYQARNAPSKNSLLSKFRPNMAMVLSGELPRLAVAPGFKLGVNARDLAITCSQNQSNTTPQFNLAEHELLNVHFGLMRQFLDSQRYVTDLIMRHIDQAPTTSPEIKRGEEKDRES